jgi:hypothetical protein
LSLEEDPSEMEMTCFMRAAYLIDAL